MDKEQAQKIAGEVMEGASFGFSNEYSSDILESKIIDALLTASSVKVPDIFEGESFFNDMCYQASKVHGTGEMNGAFKDGAEWARKWAIDKMRKEEV